jgi:hypothetical protein
MLTEELRTGAEWAREYPNIKIMDLDGWNVYTEGNPFPDRSSFNTLKISRADFEARVMQCTIQAYGPVESWMQHG